MAGCMLLCGCQGSVISQNQDLSQVLIDPGKLGVVKLDYKTGVVRTLVYEQETTVSSSVVSLQTDKLQWTQSDSRLEKFHVSNGKEVRIGEVLASFTVNVDKAKLESLKLQLEKKQQEVAAEKQLKQDAVNKAEASSQGLSGYSLQIAQLKIEKLRIALEQFEYETGLELAALSQQVEKLETAAVNTTLVAPYNGVIKYVKTSIKEGDPIDPKDVLIEIESLDRIYVKATNTTENDASAFRYNSLVTVGGQEGRVIVSPNILPGGDSGMVLIDLASGGNRNARGRITTKVHEVYDVILISTKALQQGEDYNYVNVLDGDILKRRRVTVALKNPDKYTWILEGLTDDQTVVFAN